MGCVHKLKGKQVETLHSIYEGKDTIADLSTGFGKSVLFQRINFISSKSTRFSLNSIIPRYITPLCCGMNRGPFG